MNVKKLLPGPLGFGAAPLTLAKIVMIVSSDHSAIIWIAA